MKKRAFLTTLFDVRFFLLFAAFIVLASCKKDSQTKGATDNAPEARVGVNQTSPDGPGSFTPAILTKTASGYQGIFTPAGWNITVNFSSNFVYQLDKIGVPASGTIVSQWGSFDPTYTTFTQAVAPYGIYAINSWYMWTSGACSAQDAYSSFNSFASDDNTWYANFVAWFNAVTPGLPTSTVNSLVSQRLQSVPAPDYVNSYLLPALTSADCSGALGYLGYPHSVTVAFKVVVYGYDSNNQPIFAIVPTNWVYTGPQPIIASVS